MHEFCPVALDRTSDSPAAGNSTDEAGCYAVIGLTRRALYFRTTYCETCPKQSWHSDFDAISAPIEGWYPISARKKAG